MKILLAGATGNLGREIFQVLKNQKHDLVLVAPDIECMNDYADHFITLIKADLTRLEDLRDICVGIDVVITTVGLTFVSKTLSNMDVDYRGNLHLLQEAITARVKNFIYISVYGADSDPQVPMLNAKYLFEQALQKSGLNWLIIRPTGYFIDFAKIFISMAKRGKIMLVGDGERRFNPVHPGDVAEWIGNNLKTSGKIVEIGGPEVFSYTELARLCFAVTRKPTRIKYVPVWFFSILISMMKFTRNPRYGILLFSRWTMTTDFHAPFVGRRKLKDFLQEFINTRKT